jgi:hypothetical protein
MLARPGDENAMLAILLCLVYLIHLTRLRPVSIENNRYSVITGYARQKTVPTFTFSSMWPLVRRKLTGYHNALLLLVLVIGSCYWFLLLVVAIGSILENIREMS